MFRVKFVYKEKTMFASCKDVSSYDAECLRIYCHDENKKFVAIDAEEYHDVADEAIELLYDEKYGKELEFESA